MQEGNNAPELEAQHDRGAGAQGRQEPTVDARHIHRQVPSTRTSESLYVPASGEPRFKRYSQEHEENAIELFERLRAIDPSAQLRLVDAKPGWFSRWRIELSQGAVSWVDLSQHEAHGDTSETRLVSYRISDGRLAALNRGLMLWSSRPKSPPLFGRVHAVRWQGNFKTALPALDADEQLSRAICEHGDIVVESAARTPFWTIHDVGALEARWPGYQIVARILVATSLENPKRRPVA